MYVRGHLSIWLIAWALSAPSLVAAQQDSRWTMIRVRVPDDAALAKAKETLAATYQAAYANAATATAKSDLASQISAGAAEEHADFALRLQGRKTAALLYAQAGNWHAALTECDRLCAEFNLPQAATRADIVVALTKFTPDARASDLDDDTLHALIVDTLEGCLQEDSYDSCRSLVEVLGNLEAKPGAIDPTASLTAAYRQLITTLSAEYDSTVAAARRMLATDPLNAAAHQALAKFYALSKRDAASARAHFALGDHEATRRLAIQELTAAETLSQRDALAKDYQAASSQAPEYAPWFQARARYWEIAKSHRVPEFAIKSQTPHRTSLDSTSRVGRAMQQQGLPSGAALCLTFADHLTQNSGTVTARLAAQRTVSGKRTILFDYSPRRNHAEGLFTSAGSSAGMAGLGWLCQETPVVVSHRLMDKLPAFTWTGWVKIAEHTLPAPLFCENTSLINIDQCRAPRFSLLSLPEFEAPFAFATKHGIPPTVVVRMRNFAPKTQWRFVAVTVDYAQRLRVTVNDRSESIPLGLLGDRPEKALTMIGAFRGSIDEVAFFPRPLSELEILTLFEMGLAKLPLAEYKAKGIPARTPPVDFSPLVYFPEGTTLATNSPSPPAPPGNPNQLPLPQPDAPRPPGGPKKPKPNEDEIAAARKLVRELYASDFSRATTIEKRLALAKKLHDVARDTNDSDAARYVCFYDAASLYNSADATNALEVWNELAAEFVADLTKEKAEYFDKMQKKARGPLDFKMLANGYIALLQEAVASDDYALAMQQASRAETCARKAGDAILERIVRNGTRDLRAMQQNYESAKSAKTALATNPQDTSAALIWGKYLCLYRGAWDEGLKLLAQGSDDPLVNIAKEDLETPQGLEAQAKLADAWWDAGETAADERAKRQLRRAAHWYGQAADAATGLTKARLLSRIDEYQTDASPLPVGVAIDALSLIDVRQHAVSGTWQRTAPSMIVARSDANRGQPTQIAVPLALHGSYEFSSRFEFEGNTSSIYFLLPVGDTLAVVRLGSSTSLQLHNGAQSRASVEPGVPAFDRRRRYEIAGLVELDRDQATIKFSLDGRPIIAWTGPPADLDSSTPSGFGGGRFRFGPPPGFGGGRPAPATSSNTGLPLLHIYSTSSDNYAISSLQLKLTKGWGEPVINVK